MYTKLPKAAGKVAYILLALAAGWLGLRYLLPVVAPFLAALALSALVEPVVGRLSRYRGLSRSVSAGACLLVLVGAACFLLCYVCGHLAAELRELAQGLPRIFASVAATVEGWQTQLRRYLGAVPEGTGESLQRLFDGISQRLSQLPGTLSGRALELLPRAVSATPAVLLFSATALIGSYFISASYPALLQFFSAQVSAATREKAGRIRRELRHSIGRWFQAQVILALITFAELTLAFYLLDVNYAMALALVTAVIDFLPVLGAGTVLLPWAAYSLLTGGIALGVGLIITYIAVTVLRSCMQAKLLGDQLGLPPLATLLAVYVGFKVWGVWGMIFFPILAVTLKKLNDSGMIHLWKEPGRPGEGGKYVGNCAKYHCGDGHEYPGGHEHPPG